MVETITGMKGPKIVLLLHMFPFLHDSHFVNQPCLLLGHLEYQHFILTFGSGTPLFVRFHNKYTPLTEGK